ncbi:ferric-chelate reductase [Diplocarpon rosae]|nr:ferric-chelate reductase [Diplocarpon rosae]
MGHIQVHTDDSYYVPHWGYAKRTLPCTNDAGTCEYLDAIYWMHDVSMLYTFIMWAVIGGILAIFMLGRFVLPRPTGSRKRGELEKQQQMRGSSTSSAYYRATRGFQAAVRRCLLPERWVKVFGNVTSLQVLILVIILVYLLIFSLVGIVYKTWITPVKNTNLKNTRTGFGGFADRVGALAYALTPLTVALSTRESLLTLLTGIPYQSFNFLHRWTGRIILVQSIIHTFGWTLIEGNFYKPQPKIYADFIKQPYIIWGCIALLLVCFLAVFSLPIVVRYTGHEFFRKAHYVVAGIYLGACWAHWNQLACWMIASLGIFGIDRGVRLLRTGLIHVGYLDPSKGFGFHAAQSQVQYFDDEDGGVVRLDFEHNHESWGVGQHFFLTFPALTIWQSHPLTVAAVPPAHPALPHHTYIIRARRGETGRLKTLALSQTPSSISKDVNTLPASTPVILCGPYGKSLLAAPEATNILAIAGGTGVSLTLPLALAATSLPSAAAIDFVWVIRRASNTNWVADELAVLKRRAAQGNVDLRIHIYITQEALSQSSTDVSITAVPESARGQNDEDSKVHSLTSSSSLSGNEKLVCKGTYEQKSLPSGRPSLDHIVNSFLDARANSAYRTRVIASGPAGMGHDLRRAVAASNDAGKVWKDDRRWDVGLEWDDRMH